MTIPLISTDILVFVRSTKWHRQRACLSSLTETSRGPWHDLLNATGRALKKYLIHEYNYSNWSPTLFPVQSLPNNVDNAYWILSTHTNYGPRITFCLGLGELCLKFLYYAMPAIPGNVILMLPEEAVLGAHYAQLCNGILPLTHGLGQATCCKLVMLVDYGMQL